MNLTHTLLQHQHPHSQSDSSLGLIRILAGCGGETPHHTRFHSTVSKPNHTRCAHHRLTPLPRFVEWCFLTLVGWSYKDVVCAFFFTFLLGGFACLMWSNVKRLQCKLDDIFGRIEALHQAINVGIISPPARTSRLTNYISLSNRTLLSDPPLNTSPCTPSRTFVFFREKSPHCNQS